MADGVHRSRWLRTKGLKSCLLQPNKFKTYGQTVVKPFRHNNSLIRNQKQLSNLRKQAKRVAQNAKRSVLFQRNNPSDFPLVGDSNTLQSWGGSGIVQRIMVGLHGATRRSANRQILSPTQNPHDYRVLFKAIDGNRQLNCILSNLCGSLIFQCSICNSNHLIFQENIPQWKAELLVI